MFFPERKHTVHRRRSRRSSVTGTRIDLYPFGIRRTLCRAVRKEEGLIPVFLVRVDIGRGKTVRPIGIGRLNRSIILADKPLNRAVKRYTELRFAETCFLARTGTIQLFSVTGNGIDIHIQTMLATVAFVIHELLREIDNIIDKTIIYMVTLASVRQLAVINRQRTRTDLHIIQLNREMELLVFPKVRVKPILRLFLLERRQISALVEFVRLGEIMFPFPDSGRRTPDAVIDRSRGFDYRLGGKRHVQMRHKHIIVTDELITLVRIRQFGIYRIGTQLRAVPRGTVVVHISIDTVGGRHRFKTDSLCIREIALESTLQLKIIPRNKILGFGAFHLPSQDISTRETAMLILLGCTLEIINTVVSGHIDCFRPDQLNIARLLVSIDLKGRIKSVVPRVGSRHIHRTAVLLDEDRVLNQRIGISYRLRLRVIRHSSQSPSGKTRLVNHIEIRRIELRSCRVVATGEGGGESEERMVVRT